MRLWNVSAIALVVPLLSFGCGPRGAAVAVSGAVTYAGQRVDDGAIYFVDVASQEVGGFSRVQAGRYRASVKRGHWAVRITANRPLVGKVDETGLPLIEQYVPARFNDETELTATIDSSRRLDWNLPGPGT